MPAPLPRIICFDIGGVLVSHCRSWAEGCTRAGVAVREAEWLKSERAISQRRAVVQIYQSGQCSTDEYYDRLTETLDGLYSREEVARVHLAWLIDEYPGVEHLVRGLNEDDRVITACLSNTNAAHWEQMLPASGELPYPSLAELEIQLASHHLGASKPDPEIFVRAQAQLPAPPGEILFFDDAPANVDVAREAGWHAELIDFCGDTATQLRGHLTRHLK